ALVDAEAARLDDAFLEAPAFAARVLEVQVRVVHRMRGDLGQRAAEVGFVQAERLQQQRLRRAQPFECGFAGNHRTILVPGLQRERDRRATTVRASCLSSMSSSTARAEAWRCSGFLAMSLSTTGWSADSLSGK